MTEKIVNYTPEATAKMVEMYVAVPTQVTVEFLATELGKSVKSVVAKLSREGVYVKAVRVTKAGGPVVKKDELVAEIAKAVGVNEEKMDGLEKAPKGVLKMILAALD